MVNGQLPLLLDRPRVGTLTCDRRWYGCEMDETMAMHTCGLRPGHKGRCRCYNRYQNDPNELPCHRTRPE